MNSRLFWIAIVFVCLCGSAHAGVIEICKTSDPAGSLSDPFYFFTIADQPQLGSILVPVDACSDNISLPDGYDLITETPDPTSVLEGVSTFPGDALTSVNLQTDTATVLAIGTDPSTWVTVIFTNTPAAPVPEPGTLSLLGLGLGAGILSLRRFRLIR
jgi:hypothetical protein